MTEGRSPRVRTSQVLAFVRLGRPHFLAGGFALYALGAAVAVAVAHRGLDLRAYAWGQAAITATQLMTHYANDYFDLSADRANATASPWSGGSRVLPNGELRPVVALVAAIVLGVTAFAFDVAITLRGGPVSRLVVVLLLTALALSWEYSAPPLRLHSRGLGAPTVAIVVTLLTPLVGYLLQSGDAPPALLPPLVAAVPLVCAQMGMILVIDFPDAAGDGAVGKKTPVVRFGGRAAARLAIAAVCAPYAALPGLALAGLPMRAVVAILATLPVGAVLATCLARGDWERPAKWARLTWLGAVWFAVLVGSELAAFTSLALWA